MTNPTQENKKDTSRWAIKFDDIGIRYWKGNDLTKVIDFIANVIEKTKEEGECYKCKDPASWCANCVNKTLLMAEKEERTRIIKLIEKRLADIKLDREVFYEENPQKAVDYVAKDFINTIKKVRE